MFGVGGLGHPDLKDAIRETCTLDEVDARFAEVEKVAAHIVFDLR